MDRLRKHTSTEDRGYETPCWLWTASCNQKGYGRISIGGVMHSVHRVAYQHYVGSIPVGLEIDHLCGVRNCWRPDHLEAVTHQENVARRKRKPGPAFGHKSHCPKGHSYEDPRNVLVRNNRLGNPKIECAECHRIRNKRRTP